VLNVGGSFEISVGDIARLIAELMACDVEVTSEERRMRPTGSEVERLWADNTLVRELTGWVPRYAGIEGLRRGLQETISWFTNSDNLRRYKAGLYNI
jgi:nucleoside-diphosphate-sugar epimerase